MLGFTPLPHTPQNAYTQSYTVRFRIIWESSSCLSRRVNERRRRTDRSVKQNGTFKWWGSIGRAKTVQKKIERFFKNRLKREEDVISEIVDCFGKETSRSRCEDSSGSGGVSWNTHRLHFDCTESAISLNMGSFLEPTTMGTSCSECSRMIRLKCTFISFFERHHSVSLSTGLAMEDIFKRKRSKTNTKKNKIK